MGSRMDRVRHWLGLTPEAERAVVDRKLTTLEQRVARTERVVAAYRAAELVSDAAGEDLIDEARRRHDDPL